MGEPLVSVCIPTFNAGRFLTSTLQSVFDQTFGDYEVVVADDGSTDGTLEVVAGFDDDRIRVLPPAPNTGAVANWNRAVDAARGRYVKLLCQDDLVYPHCLEHQVAVLEAPGGNGIVLVTGRRDLIDDDGRVLVSDRGLHRRSGRLTEPEVARLVARAGTNPLGEPSLALLRRDAALASGGFDAREAYLVDVDLWVRVLARGDLHHLPETLGAFRVSAGSWSGRIGADQARQARRFVRRLRAEHPDAVRPRDVGTGLARATALAWIRRALYLRERARRQRKG